jgi:hypothetical protein
MADAQILRQLKIKTGSVNRYVSYVDEAAGLR